MNEKYYEFIEQCSTIKNEINSKLLELFKKYNVKNIYCGEMYSTPIVMYSTSADDIYTLDDIIINDNIIKFDCGNSYSNDSVSLLDVDVELLIEIYKWIFDNEDNLLNKDDEKEYILYIYPDTDISRYTQNINTMSQDAKQQILDDGCGELYTLNDFIDAFNSEVISDLGYIVKFEQEG